MQGDTDAAFAVEINEELICTTHSDLTESPFTDSQIMSCGCIAYVFEGKERI